MAFVIRNRNEATWWAGTARGWVPDAHAALTFEFHIEAALITLSECGSGMDMFDIECVGNKRPDRVNTADLTGFSNTLPPA